MAFGDLLPAAPGSPVPCPPQRLMIADLVLLITTRIVAVTVYHHEVEGRREVHSRRPEGLGRALVEPHRQHCHLG